MGKSAFAEAVETAAGPRVSPRQKQALETMHAHRYGLYRYDKGYSTTGYKPYFRHDLIANLVAQGLAWADPSGGREGSVKITRAGRAWLKRQS